MSNKPFNKFDAELGDKLVNFLEVRHRDLMKLRKLETSQEIDDIATLMAFNFFSHAEKTVPEKGTRTISANITESEYDFIKHFFSTFFGLSCEWTENRFISYQLMKHPRAIALSDEAKRMQAGFKNFFESLAEGPQYTIFYNRDQRLADARLRKLPEKDQERIIEYVSQHKNYNSKVLSDLLGLWHIHNPLMFAESLGCKSTAQPRMIVDNEHSSNIKKDLVHVISKGGIDPLEEYLSEVCLRSRFEGCDDAGTKYIPETYETVKKEDMLFYLALNGGLDWISSAGIAGLQSEMNAISEKTKKAIALLKYFGSEKINAEDLAIASYGMRMIGIRGESNLGLALGEKFKNCRGFENIGGYDVEPLANYKINAESILTCRVPDLEKLAKANPKLTMSSFKEGENPFERPLF